MESARFRIEVSDAPAEWLGRPVRLVHQSRIRPVQHLASPDAAWDIEVGLKDGKWTGPNVGRNSDGRRFVYLAWLDEHGVSFRRLKLYQEQVTGPVVRVKGRMKDGSPACSTAQVD